MSYAFSQIAATIEQDTPFALSPNVALLCIIPTFVFLALLFVYRFVPHPVFSYQREGPNRRTRTTSTGGNGGWEAYRDDATQRRYLVHRDTGETKWSTDDEGTLSSGLQARSGEENISPNITADTVNMVGNANVVESLDTAGRLAGATRTAVATATVSSAMATAMAARQLPWSLRVILGLSDFDAAAIEKAGDKVLPGALPARYRGVVWTRGCAFKMYRFLWWYWQALKRNHTILAPFLAPYDPRRGHARYSGILFARCAWVGMIRIDKVGMNIEVTTCSDNMSAFIRSWAIHALLSDPPLAAPPRLKVCNGGRERYGSIPPAYMFQSAALCGDSAEHHRNEHRPHVGGMVGWPRYSPRT